MANMTQIELAEIAGKADCTPIIEACGHVSYIELFVYSNSEHLIYGLADGQLYESAWLEDSPKKKSVTSEHFTMDYEEAARLFGEASTRLINASDARHGV